MKEVIILIPLVLLVIILGIVILRSGKSNSQDHFLFEQSPGKLCKGGPYMRSSSPCIQQMCKNMPEADKKRFDCGVGYIGGGPLVFNYNSADGSEMKMKD